MPLLFLTGLPVSMTSEQPQVMARRHAALGACHLLSREHQSWAALEVTTVEGLARLVAALDGGRLDGRRLAVSRAESSQGRALALAYGRLQPQRTCGD